MSFLSFDFTPFQAIMTVCVIIEACVIFALLRHVPKNPQTKRLNQFTVGLAFVVIAAAILERIHVIH